MQRRITSKQKNCYIVSVQFQTVKQLPWYIMSHIHGVEMLKKLRTSVITSMLNTFTTLEYYYCSSSQVAVLCIRKLTLSLATSLRTKPIFPRIFVFWTPYTIYPGAVPWRSLPNDALCSSWHAIQSHSNSSSPFPTCLTRQPNSILLSSTHASAGPGAADLRAGGRLCTDWLDDNQALPSWAAHQGDHVLLRGNSNSLFNSP